MWPCAVHCVYEMKIKGLLNKEKLLAVVYVFGIFCAEAYTRLLKSNVWRLCETCQWTHRHPHPHLDRECIMGDGELVVCARIIMWCVHQTHNHHIQSQCQQRATAKPAQEAMRWHLCVCDVCVCVCVRALHRWKTTVNCHVTIQQQKKLLLYLAQTSGPFVLLPSPSSSPPPPRYHRHSAGTLQLRHSQCGAVVTESWRSNKMFCSYEYSSYVCAIYIYFGLSYEANIYPRKQNNKISIGPPSFSNNTPTKK